MATDSLFGVRHHGWLGVPGLVSGPWFPCSQIPLPAEANPPSSTAAMGVLPIWASAGSLDGQIGVVGIKSPPCTAPLTQRPNSSPWHHFTTVRVTYSFFLPVFVFLQRCRRCFRFIQVHHRSWRDIRHWKTWFMSCWLSTVDYTGLSCKSRMRFHRFFSSLTQMFTHHQATVCSLKYDVCTCTQ